MKCYRRLQNISFKELVTGGDVRRKIQAIIRKCVGILAAVGRWGWSGFGESYGRDGLHQHSLGI